MTNKEITRYSAPVVQAYRDMEDELLMLIGRQIAKDGRLSDTSKWRVRQLARAGEINRQALDIISSYSEGISNEVYDAITEAAESEVGRLDEAMLNLLSEKGELTDDVQGMLNAYERQSRQELNVKNAEIADSYARALTERCNLVNTVMAANVKAGYTAAVSEISRAMNEMNAGAVAVVSGNEGLHEATRRTIHRLARNGITGFTDKAGRQWTPEAYVKMDLRTTMANTARAAQDARCDAYGISLIEVSSHMGARPKCAPYQGRVFSRDGSRGITEDLNGDKIEYIPLSETSYGEPDGLFGINCGHQQYPFIPGLSVKSYYPYPEEENAERYRELQAQRGMERKIRADKRECMMLQAAGDGDGLKEAAVRLRQDKSKYTDYCKAHGLGVHNKNTQVFGYDRSTSMKTVWAEKNSVHYVKGDKGGIIFDKVVGEQPPSKVMIQQLNDEYQKFCGVFGEIKTVRSVSVEKYINNGIYGSYNENNEVITLRGAGGKEGAAFLAKTAKEYHKAGKWSTSSAMHAYRHELGHAWQKQLKSADPNYAKKIAKIQAKKEDFWNGLTKDENGVIINATEAQKKTLSIYGLSRDEKIDELISECAAEYVTGKPRAFAREVISILLG